MTLPWLKARNCASAGRACLSSTFMAERA